MEKITKTEAEWRAELSDEQYRILRQKGTERAFTGALYDNHAVGLYRCAACGNALYRSDQKFDSGCGWPSFFEALPGAVEEHVDDTFGMRRTEITCACCDSHLGHVFEDGPRPTGLRYCLNSGAMTFENE
jgi:peptide-methionine (R)-S-oxide reductase